MRNDNELVRICRCQSAAAATAVAAAIDRVARMRALRDDELRQRTALREINGV
jgi:hypothetical protein